jgi:hypothetical protein
MDSKIKDNHSRRKRVYNSKRNPQFSKRKSRQMINYRKTERKKE